MKRWLTLGFLLVVVSPTFGDQTVIPNYNSVRGTHFYKKVYENSGWMVLPRNCGHI